MKPRKVIVTLGLVNGIPIRKLRDKDWWNSPTLGIKKIHTEVIKKAKP